ncbi:MAG: hypothetical protein MRERV_20c003 [Mycoplasmataceae bacterium RV_VA103A]|nr:MAG: hypothetical protein MRERV_20c003 [Mycoplasmataceae bacterium RV_VA103A]
MGSDFYRPWYYFFLFSNAEIVIKEMGLGKSWFFNLSKIKKMLYTCLDLCQKWRVLPVCF